MCGAHSLISAKSIEGENEMKVRVYGKTVNEWYDEGGMLIQKEVSYKDYDTEDGTVWGIGTEDFSVERWWKDTDRKWVWTWDGKKRNRGGYRWFEEVRHLSFRKCQRSELRKLLKTWYPEAELIQLR